MEQVAELVVCGAGHDLAARQQDVGLDQRVMDETVAEAGRLDTDADRRAADRDVLELGRDGRQEPLLEAGLYDRLECGQALGFERPAVAIDPDDLVELAERDTPFRPPARLIAEQVRYRGLGEAQLAAAAFPGIEERGFLLLVARFDVRNPCRYRCACGTTAARSSPSA
jgi:hypothetical protein